MDILKKTHVDSTDKLKIINGIHFTSREIDIIACLLNARGTSRIASLLEISPRTVGNHIRNLMVKLGCNSREGIIDFVEKDNKQALLRAHYVHLGLEKAFQNVLKTIGRLLPKVPSWPVIYWKGDNDLYRQVEKIKVDLERAGLITHLEIREKPASIVDLIDESKEGKHTFYMLSQRVDGIKRISPSPKLSPHDGQLSTNALFLFIEGLDSGEIPHTLGGIKCIDFSKPENYYFSVFEVLKTLFPHVNIEDKIKDFKNWYEPTSSSSEINSSQESIENTKELPFSFTKQNLLKGKRWKSLIISLAFVSPLIIGFYILQEGTTILPTTKTLNAPVRSDLPIPHEERLLERPNLINEVDNKFKAQKEGIQTVAIIGLGGAGKTTAARHYAHQQDANIVWEMHAETRGSLNGSFEKFGLALAKTEADKRILKEILDIKDSTTRKEKTITFVKEHLKAREPWFLIYDDVENFADIQKYFPQDKKTWGEGKVLLTTRNNNISNSSYINQVVYIGELSPEQKLKLFVQIMSQGKDKRLTITQTEEAKEFLKNIPPFPLDISVAAYYLKTAKIPYTQYLEHLYQEDKNFTAIQEHFLEEMGEYAKTRYSIITLSLKRLIAIHKDFKDLLLFITLVNSQHIPRELLDHYKDDVIVNKFIYHLKKHSLIMNESSSPSRGLIFSLHKSTQSISLQYLAKMLRLESDPTLINLIAANLQSYLAEIIQKEDFTRMKMMVNHCKRFLNYGISIGIHHLNISSQMGDIYYLFGDYLKSQKILEESLNILNLKDNRNYLLKAELLSCLGNTYKKLGYYKKAENFLENSLSIYKQYFPENSMGLTKNFMYLGSLSIDHGKYEKAKEFLESSLFRYAKYFANHPGEFARTLSHLGHAYRHLGQLEKSRELLERSLTVYRTYLPENHVNIAWVLVHLAASYRELKEYGKSTTCLNKGLTIYKNHFSEQDPKVAWTLSHFGHTHKKAGNYEAAKAAYQKSLLIYEKNYGKNYVASGLVLKHLGQTYILAGHIEEAEKILQQALEIFLTTKHPDVYECLTLLTELNLNKSLELQNKGDIKQALYFKNKATQYLQQAKVYFSEDSEHLTKVLNKFKILLGEI